MILVMKFFLGSAKTLLAVGAELLEEEEAAPAASMKRVAILLVVVVVAVDAAVACSRKAFTTPYLWVNIMTDDRKRSTNKSMTYMNCPPFHRFRHRKKFFFGGNCEWV